MHCCWQNAAVSANFTTLILSNLHDTCTDPALTAFKHHLEGLGFMFAVQDTLAERRAKEVCEAPPA